MARNPNVSRLSDVGGSLDVSNTLIERPALGPFEHNVRELQPGNFKST
jgi:hypothetical protein